MTYYIRSKDPQKAPIEHYAWTEQYPAVIAAFAAVCYDESALHVTLCAQETDLRCETKNPNEMVCTDSCLEFFLNPMPEMGDAYFNFEFNPRGNYFLAIGTGRADRRTLVLSDYPFDFAVKTAISDTDWTVSFSIPYGFIRTFFPDFTIYPGKVLKGNFYKCGDHTAHVHFGTWSPVATPKPDFHRPEYFGRLIVE